MSRMVTRLRFGFLIGIAGCICFQSFHMPSAVGDQQMAESSDAIAGDWQATVAELRQVQERLQELGFDPGRPDGVLGQRTKAALQAYQRSINETANGLLTLELYQRIIAGQEGPAESAEPAPGEDIVSAEVECIPILIGTWQFADELGSRFALTLRPDGSVEGTSYPRHWRWQATAQDIEIIYDNGMGTTVTRVGRVNEGEVMLGDAKDSRGRAWAWKAVRLPSDSASNQELCVQDQTP